jgi:hypothetical protein
MRVVTCVSFHGTGSGAVDDFLKEFDNCPSAPSDVECRFLQDPDGVSDLEYNLIENPHRLNSGYALKRYLKFAKESEWTYSRIFGNKWMEYSREYIDSLISEKYKGYWHGDLKLLSPVEKLIYYGRRGVNKLRPKKFKKPCNYNYYPNKDFWHSYITRDKFIQETQNYVERLCGLLNPEGYELVVLDQLVATSNIKRYFDYVKDLRVIVVDRDPRDLYINCMEAKGHVLPKDPEVFARVYRDQREMMGEIPENLQVLKVMFEDLIFNYEETTQKIMDFIGQTEEHHIKKKQIFDPAVSKKNTKMWERLSKYSDAAKYLEKELPEYLYNYK